MPGTVAAVLPGVESTKASFLAHSVLARAALVACALVAGALSTGCSATAGGAAPLARPLGQVSFALAESTLAKTRAGDEPAPPLVPDASPDASPRPERLPATPPSSIAACRDMTPTAALRLFVGPRKHRVAYAARERDTLVAAGRAGRGARGRARWDEEVLVLSQNVSWSSATNSSRVTYDVLRWNGMCASLEGGALSFARAAHPVRPVHIERLELATQVTLLEDRPVHAALERADAACGSAPKGASCEAAQRSFEGVLVTRAPHLALSPQPGR